MPTNDFIGFASAGSANIMSQADYAAAAEQTDGMQPGLASSKLANKAWRQGANMAAALGGVIAARGYDALDDGDIATLQSHLESALCETGTWTPLINGASNGVITQNYVSPTWVKIGRIVYCYASGTLLNDTGTGAAVLRPSSLPFTMAHDYVLGTLFFNSDPYMAFYTASRIYFRNPQGGVNLTSADISSSTGIFLGFIYETAQ